MNAQIQRIRVTFVAQMTLMSHSLMLRLLMTKSRFFRGITFRTIWTLMSGSRWTTGRQSHNNSMISRFYWRTRPMGRPWFNFVCSTIEKTVQLDGCIACVGLKDPRAVTELWRAREDTIFLSNFTCSLHVYVSIFHGLYMFICSSLTCSIFGAMYQKHVNM